MIHGEHSFILPPDIFSGQWLYFCCVIFWCDFDLVYKMPIMYEVHAHVEVQIRVIVLRLKSWGQKYEMNMVSHCNKCNF